MTGYEKPFVRKELTSADTLGHDVLGGPSQKGRRGNFMAKQLRGAGALYIRGQCFRAIHRVVSDFKEHLEIEDEETS